jgi:hypothetical protein
MERRQFLAGAGALFFAGCAGQGAREWSDVPWVEGAAPPLPPPSSARVVAPPCPPTALAAARPAVAPPRPPAPVPRRPAFALVSRAAWGAEPLKGNHDPMGRIERITLHHTDEHAGMRGRSDLEVVRAIQTYHRDTLGWADIGYHYLVGRDGRIYEGRALTAQGAHSGGANNRNNLGVSVIGNFSGGVPPAAQLEAVAAFLADRRAAYGLRPAALFGHRDFGPTECPGNALYAWLQDQKRRAV